MTVPHIFKAKEIKTWSTGVRTSQGWQPYRGQLCYDGAGWFDRLVRRFQVACGVFTGRYDALDWNLPEPKTPKDEQ